MSDDRAGHAAATGSGVLPGLPIEDRCLVMGVVNVTPDSFSDGGAWLDPDKEVAHGLELATQGADIIDVGGESTRPGAQRVPMEHELRRVLPVVESLASAGSYVSIDTMRAEVARQAIAAGARMVNDVS
ncbi:MAG TPA: dihydropteroate synthase, partial [Streptosporangiaceae bacterium]